MARGRPLEPRRGGRPRHRRQPPSRWCPAWPAPSARLVRRIVAPNPGMMTGPGTNTYLVGIDEIAVIDPGPDDDDAPRRHRRLRRRSHPLDPLHPHPPRPLARRGRSEGAHRAPRSWPSTSQDGLKVDTRIKDGFRIEATEFRLRAVHTPGHASNHLCFLLEEERAALLGRSHHAGVDRRHQPARRRHGRVPRVARQGAQAPVEGHRARPRSR